MKRFLFGAVGLLIAIFLFAKSEELIFSRYEPPAIVGYSVGSNDLTEASRTWFSYYTEALKGVTVPYDYRIQDARLDSVETLEDGYIQLNYTVYPASRNETIIQNLELISTGQRYAFQRQAVLRWESDGDQMVIRECLRPVQYQIQSPEFKEEQTAPQTQHYAMSDEPMTYYISGETLYVTYDAGASFAEVPDGYETVCRDANGRYQELLSRNSYVITETFTGFLSYSGDGVSLLYSTDAGNTWQESPIRSSGFKANSFLSQTDSGYYATFAVDRSLGHDYYATYYSSDCRTWTQLSLPDTITSGLSASFWAENGFGYYADGSDGYYLTKDGGTSFQRMEYPQDADVTKTLGYNPFDTPEEWYQEDGILYMVVGQGDDGDYTRDGRQIKALYESLDGEAFTFVREMEDTAELAG